MTPTVALTDAYKQARVDSIKDILDSLSHTARPYGMRVNSNKPDTIIPKLIFPPLSAMPSYLAPFRKGALQADRDGNIWILPSASDQSRGGGVVYDVVNRSGVLFERVRAPQD